MWFLLGGSLGWGMEPGEFELSWTNRMATLSANEAPLNAILDRFAEETGVPIQTDSRYHALITANMTGYVFEKLIKGICEGAVFTYAVHPETGEHIIEEVRISAPVSLEEKKKMMRESAISKNKLDERLAPGKQQFGAYVGIGARLLFTEDKQAVWIRPLSDGSPAAQAGIQLGDKVISVNGKSISAYASLGDISRDIKGQVGSSVPLAVMHSDGSVENISVPRRRIAGGR